ncbi:hypothetical protein BV25DRAFT_1702465 [Artomyces pyxidatus]|uniref:Uncharacterized protein n=1 Tax=Artomyces pyxidatus TaxID=48021 RepID=A0ACB8TAD6_9AGAM|nr:hypothetical protein BV25DRAFT_1702465 [Artomyces pyxidatus]
MHNPLSRFVLASSWLLHISDRTRSSSTSDVSFKSIACHFRILLFMMAWVQLGPGQMLCTVVEQPSAVLIDIMLEHHGMTLPTYRTTTKTCMLVRSVLGKTSRRRTKVPFMESW